MPYCTFCRTYFRTPEGEEQDHDCPKCGGIEPNGSLARAITVCTCGGQRSGWPERWRTLGGPR